MARSLKRRTKVTMLKLEVGHNLKLPPRKLLRLFAIDWHTFGKSPFQIILKQNSCCKLRSYYSFIIILLGRFHLHPFKQHTESINKSSSNPFSYLLHKRTVQLDTNTKHKRVIILFKQNCPPRPCFFKCQLTCNTCYTHNSGGFNPNKIFCPFSRPPLKIFNHTSRFPTKIISILVDLPSL